MVSFTSVSAQEAGQWTIGPRANIYTNTGDGAILGLGAFARYNLTDAWRLEPAITALFHSGCSVDINCDVHYMFELTRGWTLYPVAGLTISELGDWALGMNLGVGTDFAVARNLGSDGGCEVDAGVREQPEESGRHHHRRLLQVLTAKA